VSLDEETFLKIDFMQWM